MGTPRSSKVRAAIWKSVNPGTRIDESWKSLPATSFTAASHAGTPALPVVSSVPSMSQKRTVFMSCDLRNAIECGAELLHEPWNVEPVIREHLVIGPALRQ